MMTLPDGCRSSLDHCCDRMKTTFPGSIRVGTVALSRCSTFQREHFTRHAPRQRLPAPIPYQVRLGGHLPGSRLRLPSLSGSRIIAFASPFPSSHHLLLLLRLTSLAEVAERQYSRTYIAIARWPPLSALCQCFRTNSGTT